jgi:predicted kinase
MKKKLILVAGPPACGKNFVSNLLCERVQPIAYLDKDDLADLVRNSFAICHEKLDMDGAFYANHLRPAEYSTLFHLAFSALRFQDLVLVNAPFSKEVRDHDYMQSLQNRAKQAKAKLVLIWVTAPLSVCYERMKSRNSDRDTLKLENWNAYASKINYDPPYDLKNEGIVDELIVFYNENETALAKALQETVLALTD